MTLPLHIVSCIRDPPGAFHPPPPDKPLRIQIEGPLTAVQKLLPEVVWRLDTTIGRLVFPQPAGPELAKLTFRAIYGRDPRPDTVDDLVVRDEYLGWLANVVPHQNIDYYGVTFDHLVPEDDTDPEVLQININETDEDDAAYANKYLPFAVDAAEYRGQKVLAVPRCCQIRKGTQDRGRVNDGVKDRVFYANYEDVIKY
ncbi:hypothetical protein F4825DRAFT_456453 [Nemania diffusa]|nr:hypothetical protein F4825DRAFT_456453 [Nemania diffusa]